MLTYALIFIGYELIGFGLFLLRVKLSGIKKGRYQQGGAAGCLIKRGMYLPALVTKEVGATHGIDVESALFWSLGLWPFVLIGGTFRSLNHISNNFIRFIESKAVDPHMIENSQTKEIEEEIEKCLNGETPEE